MVRLVLFDIDGTLIRSGGAGVRAFKETFASEFNLPNATDSVVFAGRTDVSLVRQIFAANGIEPNAENFTKFFGQYPMRLEHFLGILEGGPCEGVMEFLGEIDALKDRPTLGLLTGNIRMGAELKLRRFGLWERFVMGAYADDHEDRNCIAGIAKQRGSQLLGRELSGEEILVIGDTGHDVICGKSIGAKVLAVGTGGISKSSLAAHGPTWLVDDLRQIRAAEVLA